MRPLIVLTGPTASGKTALSLFLARQLSVDTAPAEILSCDSVCVYRLMQLGTAKPTAAERRLVPHHLLDLYDPTEACTAGDYARHARHALAELARRKALPILSGGTGLYLRALVDGLFPSPPPQPALRSLLRRRATRRGAPHLHRSLQRFDPAAARRIHPNDAPKLIRALEVSLAARPDGASSITSQWSEGRDALTGYRILRLTLDPPRARLYARIDERARAMFAQGLVEETRALLERFGPDCRPFQSLGYQQAAAVLDGSLSEAEAIAQAQQGHRKYAKRQLTWFRKEAGLHATHVLAGSGDERAIQQQALGLVVAHLEA